MARVRQLPPARRNGAARRFLLDDLYASTADQRRRTNGVRVRVVEYTLEDHPKHETYRLMTTLLDHVQAPALELAALYPERWEMEGVFDELKTHLRGGQQVVLRSKTPALVEQEIYGLLLAHRAVRTLMCRAAQGAQLDPDRLSFTHSVRVLRRKLARPPAFPPQQSARWLSSILLEILRERSVSRRGRRIPRGLKRKMSGYPLRHARAPTQVQFYPPVIAAPSSK